jgi:hypothetical protein
MRRILLVVVLLGVSALSATAMASGSGNYRDKFESIGWGGSDGSLDWTGPWTEISDDGDAKKGNVRVVSSGNCQSGNCIRMSGLLAGIGARRSADTGAIEDLRLRYDVRNVVTLLPLGLTELEVEVGSGGEWTQVVATHNLGANFSDGYSFELSDELGADDFQIRFRVIGAAMTSQVFIDNIEIDGDLPEETTTTTTSTSTTTTTPGTTTTTTHATTTTTSAPITTTTRPSSTTTDGSETPGTTSPASSTSTSGPASSSTTTTTTPRSDRSGIPAGFPTPSTSTTISTSEDGTGAAETPASPDRSGIRAAARGLQAGFQADLFGEVRTVSSLNRADFRADYNMAVEVIRSSWAWMVLLGLVVAWAMVSGLDRRRGEVGV